MSERTDDMGVIIALLEAIETKLEMILDRLPDTEGWDLDVNG